MSTDLCKACFRTGETKPVQVRYGERGEPWVESSIRRCANDECWNTTGGTLEERLTHIRNVYDYKYFGDYELSPEQNDAVWEAKALAQKVPLLLSALKTLRAAAFHEDNLLRAAGMVEANDKALAAIASAEEAQ